jgi:hypothetical protein
MIPRGRSAGSFKPGENRAPTTAGKSIDFRRHFMNPIQDFFEQVA